MRPASFLHLPLARTGFFFVSPTSVSHERLTNSKFFRSIHRFREKEATCWGEREYGLGLLAVDLDLADKRAIASVADATSKVKASKASSSKDKPLSIADAKTAAIMVKRSAGHAVWNAYRTYADRETLYKEHIINDTTAALQKWHANSCSGT